MRYQLRKKGIFGSQAHRFDFAVGRFARGFARWFAGRSAQVFATACLLSFCAVHAAAQGCAMCYQNAAASGPDGRAALRHGILILLFPALGVFFGVFLLIFRRRNLPREDVADIRAK